MMMKKKYITPKTETYQIDIEMYAASAGMTMGKNSETTIDSSDEILTKQRSFFDEMDMFGNE